MLSKTHIAVGTAGALTIFQPQTINLACPVIVGGIVGSVICDIDCKARDSKDAFLGRIIAGMVSAVGVLIDVVYGGPIIIYLREISIIKLVTGVLILFATGCFARESEHRVFSHSLLAFILYATGLFLCCRPLTYPFVIGYASHLFLDVLTYRPVHLFYPCQEGVSMKLCKSKSRANVIIMVLGFLWLVGIVGYLLLH